VTGEEEAAPEGVRRLTWRVPVALWASGFVLKVLLSLFVNETAGDVVGGTLGFASLVACLLLARSRGTGTPAAEPGSPHDREAR
jgi:hypothetical protein